MMKWILTVVIGSTLFLAAAANAQEPGRTLGLGIGLQPLSIVDDASVLASAAPALYVPFVVTDNIMVEPSIGFTRVNREQSGGGATASSSISVFRLGVGVLMMSPLGDDGRAYFGPRVGLIRTSQSEESETFDFSQEQLDFSIAGVTGAEFFLAEQFSLGGELGLEYVRAGNPDLEPAPDPDFEQGGSTLRILTELRVRWYFR